MNRSVARSNDADHPALPLNIALFTGELRASIVMLLANVTLGEAKRAIAAWLRSGVVAEAPTRRAFPCVRSLAREAALATSTPRQRRRAYAEIARALDEPDAGESELLDIARYYRDGGQYRLAIARYLHVAERTLERAQRDRAAAILAEAAASIPADGPEMLALLDLQTQCALEAGDMELARATLERLRRLAAGCGNRAASVRALLRCADCSSLSDAPHEAIGFASRAIDLCDAFAESAVEKIDATLVIAQALCDQGRTPQADVQWRTAQALGAAREPALAARYHYLAGSLARTGHDPVAAAIAFRAAAVAANIAGDVAAVLRATRALAAAQMQSADLFSAASTLRSALHIARAQRLAQPAVDIADDLADVQFEAGRFADALRIVSADAISPNAIARLRIALQLKDRQLIERWASPDSVEDALASRSPQRIGRAVPVYAALERHRSEDAAAQALYRQAIETLQAAGVDAPSQFWCDAAQYCAATEWDAVRTALERLRRVALPPLDALVVELGSVALAVRVNGGRADLATRAEAAALEFLTAGFKTWSRRAQAIAASIAPPNRTQHVVSLIGAGRSNAEIAAHLFVSKRTVEKTISDLLKQHGVRSRWQLLPSGDVESRPAEPPLNLRRGR